MKGPAVTSPKAATRSRDVNRNWFFRANAAVNPMLNGRLLGMVMIGKVLTEIDYSEIETRLGSVPFPQKGAVPKQNCVT